MRLNFTLDMTRMALGSRVTADGLIRRRIARHSSVDGALRRVSHALPSFPATLYNNHTSRIDARACLSESTPPPSPRSKPFAPPPPILTPPPQLSPPPPARPGYRSLRESRRRVQLTARLSWNVYARRKKNACPRRDFCLLGELSLLEVGSRFHRPRRDTRDLSRGWSKARSRS